jgi:flagellar biosynthesis protein FlhG
MSAQIWVVGAGKGGVGKTFVSSSLGITLAKLNYKVLLVDFDFSGANLHTCFGESPSAKNISQYFSKEQPLSDLVQTTRIPRLSLIQGFWDSWSPAEVSREQVLAFIDTCKQLPFDYVLFDLGAGVTSTHLEIFHHADERILISTAEPTSVEKNYRFIEAFICHSLKACSTPAAIENLDHALRTYRATHKKGYFSFREHLATAVGFEFDFFEKLQNKPLRLIINESRSRLDEDLGQSIKSVCHKYYDLSVDAAGCIDFDNAVWQSVKSREPILIEKPFTPLAAQFLMICKHLTNPNFHANFYRAVV